MSRRTQDVQFALTGQSIFHDCPDGRPTAVTDVQVWDYAADDTSTEESATTGVAAIETTPNTVTDVASGASEDDPTTVYLTATTGITSGRRYLLASSRGHSEWVEVVQVVSGDYVILKHPLLLDYAVGSTFKSTRVSITLDPTWIADVSNVSPTFTPNPRWRAKWTCVIGGSTYDYESAFDVVRYTSRHGVTPLDVAARVPNWLDYLPTDSRAQQGRDLIDRAWEAFKFDLYADNKADQALRNPEAVDQLVLVKTLAMSVEDRVLMGAATQIEADAAEGKYRARYDQMLRAPVLNEDKSGGGAATPTKPRFLLVR
jgi:hypothetical protein